MCVILGFTVPRHNYNHESTCAISHTEKKVMPKHCLSFLSFENLNTAHLAIDKSLMSELDPSTTLQICTCKLNNFA